MPYFVRESIKSSRCVALYQYYELNNSDEVFIVISTEIKVGVHICEILVKKIEYVNKQTKIFEIEYKSRFEDYKNIHQSEQAKNVNDKLRKLTIRNKLKNLDPANVMMGFDTTRL